MVCLDVVELRTTKRLIWYTLEISSRGGVFRLGGLSARGARALESDLRRFVNDHLNHLLGSEIDRMREIDAAIHSLVAARPQYLSISDMNRAIGAVPGPIAAAMSHPLLDAERAAPMLRAALPSSFELLTDPAAREDYNERFVASELTAFRTFFDDLDGRSLSGQQREACIRLEDNNLLVASAGSGKSATMVGKVAYVLEKALYRPEEILVVAFNKTAAKELQTRIAEQLDVEEDELRCKVTTFHALGRGIIQEVEGRPPQLANWVDHPAGEAKAIEEIIRSLGGSDAEFMRSWLDLLVLHPKADIPREAFDAEIDFQRYVAERRTKGSATIGTLSGIYVKSLQEQSIGNWLWLNSVDFEYEKQILIESAEENAPPRHVHPDFYYPATGTVHEHFALNADGSSPFSDYAVHAEGKRRGYGASGIDFFETTSAQAMDGSMLTVLQSELERRQVPLKRRSADEVFAALQPTVIKHYHQLIGTCIKHVRANHLALEVLLERAGSLHDKKRARIFAQVLWRISEAYSQKLEQIDRIDFDSMIADATRLVETRRYASPYAMIMVDEFQDISEPRADLIRALRRQNPAAKVFAVGDDWQSIYRFAGSDISLFTHFEERFGASWQGRLEQTYRCNQLIADAAARFVQRNPAQLKKSVRSTKDAIPKSIRVIPIKGQRGKVDFRIACLRVLARLDHFLGSIVQQWRSETKPKLSALVLWRYNALDPFKGSMPQFDHIEVEAMSFHRSKGLEADYVLMLDVSEGDYGVPSRVEDDELLHLVIPEPESFPYAEERRLFYVALTRAIRGVFLLTNADQQSRYIDELCDIAGSEVRIETIDGEALSRCPKCGSGHLVERRPKGGRAFAGCSRYPDCKHTASALSDR